MVTRLATRLCAARGLIAALLLAILALGPGLDALICGGDLSISAAASETSLVAVQAAEHPAGDHGPGADGACVHGHCHHSAPFVPAHLAEESVVSGLSVQHDLGQSEIQTSDRQFGLKRPPRG